MEIQADQPISQSGTSPVSGRSNFHRILNGKDDLSKGHITNIKRTILVLLEQNKIGKRLTIIGVIVENPWSPLSGLFFLKRG
jgi:hypothetical protein